MGRGELFLKKLLSQRKQQAHMREHAGVTMETYITYKIHFSPST